MAICRKSWNLMSFTPACFLALLKACDTTSCVKGITLQSRLHGIWIAWVDSGTFLLVTFLVCCRNIVRRPRSICSQRSPSNSLLRMVVSSASQTKGSIHIERRPVGLNASNNALVSAASNMRLRPCGFLGLATSATGLLMLMPHFFLA